MANDLVRAARVRAGFSSVEFMMAAVILGAALVPMYSMFVRSSTTITRSRLAYTALQVAREEIEELRQLPFAAVVSHDWEPVTGHLFRRTLPHRGQNTSPLAALPLNYPDEYKRIETKVTVAPLTDAPSIPPRYKEVVVEVRYQETGEGSERQPPAISRFETLVGVLNVERPNGP